MGIYCELGFAVKLVVLFPHSFCPSTLSLSPTLPKASAQDPKDLCDLPNCTRPKAVEANGYKYNYCCRDHALKDGEGGTMSVHAVPVGIHTRHACCRVYYNGQ